MAFDLLVNASHQIGFAIPIRAWLFHELGDWMNDLVPPENLKYVNPKAVR